MLGRQKEVPRFVCRKDFSLKHTPGEIRLASDQSPLVYKTHRDTVLPPIGILSKTHHSFITVADKVEILYYIP